MALGRQLKELSSGMDLQQKTLAPEALGFGTFLLAGQ